MHATRRSLDGLGAVLLLIGLGAVANALWMLAGPMHWYVGIPADVPDTGPFNPHLVRDVGCAFLAAGAALVWAAFAPAFRLPLVAASGLFWIAHALLHVYETATGILGHHHWWLDLPLVYVPALILAGTLVHLYRRQRRLRAARPTSESPGPRIKPYG